MKSAQSVPELRICHINDVQHMFWEPGNDHTPSATMTVINVVIALLSRPACSDKGHFQALLNPWMLNPLYGSTTLQRKRGSTALKVRQGRERLVNFSFQPLVPISCFLYFFHLLHKENRFYCMISKKL